MLSLRSRAIERLELPIIPHAKRAWVGGVNMSKNTKRLATRFEVALKLDDIHTRKDANVAQLMLIRKTDLPFELREVVK